MYLFIFYYRGAPHLHSLLWLVDKENVAPSTFWFPEKLKKSNIPDELRDILEKDNIPTDPSSDENTDADNDNQEKTSKEILEETKKKIAKFATKVVFGSIDDAWCKEHRMLTGNDDQRTECKDCQTIQERVKAFNYHRCTFTCHKKKRFTFINKNEGFGRLDTSTTTIRDRMEIPKCRFNVPFFPMDETMFLQGVSRDANEEDEVKKRRQDLRKIRKFLLRQSYGHEENSDSWSKLKSLDFWKFLYEVGMFEDGKEFVQYTDAERQEARRRYLNAISVGIRGTGAVFLRRGTKDIFLNNFNPNLMLLHAANHDLQVVVDQFAVAQYIVGYLTKNEAGMSQLLKNINDNAENLSKMDLLNQLASVLDKHREVSIQEATYRLMGFPMVKSSTVVKYVTTCHPNFRDGLLKSNIQDIDDKTESIFHDSPSIYYENRPINKPYYYEDEFIQTSKSMGEKTKQSNLDKTWTSDSEYDDDYDKINVKNDTTSQINMNQTWRPEQDEDNTDDELNQTWAKRRKERQVNLNRTWTPDVPSSGEDEINVKMGTTSQENIDQTWRPDIDSDNTEDEFFNAEDQENEKYFKADEKKPNYWDNLTFAEFMAYYDIVYKKERPTNCLKLRGKNVFIRRRTQDAVLRYYLRFDDIEEYCRGLLILFYPYRNEMVDVHEKNVIELAKNNFNGIRQVQAKFEAHKTLTDIINEVQKKLDEQVAFAEFDEDEEEIKEDKEFFETTSKEEMQDFESWAKSQAEKQLKSVKEFTNLQDITALRQSIIGLNSQQRSIFDDVMEQEFKNQIENKREPYYLYISGAAGTGKSFLVRVMTEAIKHINVKPGSELDKPSVISMAPTANAAYVLKDAKTIDSALCFNRCRNYMKLSGSKEASLKFQYEDVSVIIIDEISMVGTAKFTKINYRLQDIASGMEKYKFMGGRSLLTTGQ